MNNTESPAIDKPDEFLDIEPAFREVAQKYGRSMFALVYNAGMARQAIGVLLGQAEKHRSGAILKAAQVLGQAFNVASAAYVAQMKWDEGTLAQCDRDIGLAFAGKIVIPEAGSRIILDS